MTEKGQVCKTFILLVHCFICAFHSLLIPLTCSPSPSYSLFVLDIIAQKLPPHYIQGGSISANSLIEQFNKHANVPHNSASAEPIITIISLSKSSSFTLHKLQNACDNLHL